MMRTMKKVIRSHTLYIYLQHLICNCIYSDNFKAFFKQTTDVTGLYFVDLHNFILCNKLLLTNIEKTKDQK
jgi:fucose 4-O-acetylase-like acetyltransferase